MASEIRVNQIQNRSGLTTTTFTDTGVTISGILTVSENLNVGGVVTYEDVTNVDSVGVITARQGIKVTADGTSSSNYISAGASDDLKLYHTSGGNSHIKETGGGSLVINADDFYLQNNATTTFLRTHSSGAIDLNFGGNKKFETTNSGTIVTGVCTATSFSGSGANLTNLPVPTTITVADESSDTTCNPLFVTTTSGNLAPKTGTNLVFNSSSGNLRTGSLFLGTGSNESKTQDGLILERNSGDGEVHISAGRSGGNYSGMQFYVAGGSGVTKRHQMVYDGTFRWYGADGTTEKLKLEQNGRLTSTATNNGQIIHIFRNNDTTSGSSAMTVEHHFNFNRTGGGMDSSAGRIVAGKEREWVGAASNQDGYLAFHTLINESSTEKLRISSSGHVTKPYQPSFSANSASTYWTHGSSTGTLAVDNISTELFDIGGNYNHSTSVFTAPVAGKYFFSLTYAYVCTSGYLNVHLKKGVGGTYSTYGRFFASPPQQSAHYTGPALVGIMDLAAGNTVRPMVEVNYAGNQLVNLNFSGYLLG